MSNKLPAKIINRLNVFDQLIHSQKSKSTKQRMHLGVDLGTANIVLAVVDDARNPIAGISRREFAVKDGIVVDWLGALRAVKESKLQLEKLCKTTFTAASVTIPPGMSEATKKIFSNVLNGAELEVLTVVDEPVAAASALGITSGAVIDIGHGTTGVSILKDTKTISSIDEATGGHHMDLVISGNLGLDLSQAEKFKCNPDNAGLVAGLVQPTLTKMATIAKKTLAKYHPENIYLVGGSAAVPKAREVFSSVLEQEVILGPYPLWITPLGAALVSAEIVVGSKNG